MTVIPCPACGLDARRVPIYESQYINGETVAKGTKATRAGNIKNKHGQVRLSLYQEAAEELAHAQREQDVVPNYYEMGMARAAQLRKAGVKSISEVG